MCIDSICTLNINFFLQSHSLLAVSEYDIPPCQSVACNRFPTRKPSSCFDGMTLEDGMADGKKAQELWEACIPVSDLRQENWDLLTYHLKIQVCCLNNIRKTERYMGLNYLNKKR